MLAATFVLRALSLSTSPVLLSTLRSWLWHISVPDSCSGQHETLISIASFYLPKQTPSLELQGNALCSLASLPCCAASKFSCVTQSSIHWGYRPMGCVVTFDWPPSLLHPSFTFCFMMGMGYNIIRLRTILLFFFLCI